MRLSLSSLVLSHTTKPTQLFLTEPLVKPVLVLCLGMDSPSAWLPVFQSPVEEATLEYAIP